MFQNFGQGPSRTIPLRTGTLRFNKMSALNEIASIRKGFMDSVGRMLVEGLISKSRRRILILNCFFFVPEFKLRDD